MYVTCHSASTSYSFLLLFTPVFGVEHILVISIHFNHRNLFTVIPSRTPPLGYPPGATLTTLGSHCHSASTSYSFLLLFTPAFSVEHTLVISIHFNHRNLLTVIPSRTPPLGYPPGATLTTLGSQFCYTKMNFLYKLFL